MQKFRFTDIFQVDPSGSLLALIPINVNGVSISPGYAVAPGTLIGGIDFHEYKYLDIGGEYVDEILHIRGFFRKTSVQNA